MSAGSVADSLSELFARTCAEGPDRCAVVWQGERTSYAELAAMVSNVEALLRDAGIGPGSRVCIKLEAGLPAVVAILGVLGAGAAYVPLDVHAPPARDEFIVADCGAQGFIGAPAPLGGPELVVDPIALDRAMRAPIEAPPPPPQGTGAVSGAAYVLYTSGTTGHPKGVEVTHANVLALLAAAEVEFDFRADDVWLLFHSLAFDFSVWELWGALSHGSALVVPSEWDVRSPRRLLELLEEHQVSVLNQTPTAFTVLSEWALSENAELGSLRYVVFGGERLWVKTWQRWVDHFGFERPALVNMYGITEATVHATLHRILPPDLEVEASNIGCPLPGFRLLLLDRSGAEVGTDEYGEIVLAGPQVTGGYLNRPEETSSRFHEAAEPVGGGATAWWLRTGDLAVLLPSGELGYHGRLDRQVKLRGHRIELSEVEAVLRRHPAVHDVFVDVVDFTETDQRLVAAVAVGEGATTSTAELRALATDALPAYMWPSRYVLLTSLPRTTNGKVDREQVVAELSLTSSGAGRSG